MRLPEPLLIGHPDSSSSLVQQELASLRRPFNLQQTLVFPVSFQPMQFEKSCVLVMKNDNNQLCTVLHSHVEVRGNQSSIGWTPVKQSKEALLQPLTVLDVKVLIY
jgi:hypothetical protein